MAKRKKAEQDFVSPTAEVGLLPDVYLERHIVIGDLHLRRTDPLGVVEADGLNTRLKDKLLALEYAISYGVKNKATHIDILGDVFDAVNPPEELKRLFWSVIRPALDADMWVTIIIGNHDTTGKFFNFSGDAVIADRKIRIVNKTAATFIDASGGKMVYIPYLHRDKLLIELSNAGGFTNKPEVIFGHFEIEGAELAPDNAAIREGLDRTQFDGVPVILLGHIHKYQELRPGMFYVGSAVKCDFGEINNRKVFCVLDVTADAGYKTTFIDIPQRQMQQITIAENNPDNVYLSDNIPPKLKERGILLKFVLEGTKEWVSAIDGGRLRQQFPHATRIVTEKRYWDTDRPATELVTTNMIDRVHGLVKAKSKGLEFLAAGLALAKEAQEIDL